MYKAILQRQNNEDVRKQLKDIGVASWMIRNYATLYGAKSSLESLDKYQATVEAAAEAILSVRGCVMNLCLPK